MAHFVKKLLVMIVLIIGIPACSNGNDTSRLNNSGVSKETLYGFYKYDEKYKGSVIYDKKSYNTWIELKINKLSSGEPMYNLFGKHNGGGPGGAEWNSDADIIGIIHLPSNRSIIEKIDISINHLLVDIPRVTKKNSSGDMFILFELSSNFWNKRLHQIGKKDYQYLYDIASREDEINNPELLHSDGTNTYLIENEIVGKCFIIEAEIKYKKGICQKVSGSFLIAYGE